MQPEDGPPRIPLPHGLPCTPPTYFCHRGGMTVQLVRVPVLTPAPYAYASRAGKLVFTAGACPLNADGATVAPGDVAVQAEQVMANLRAALHAAGASLSDILKSTVYVATSDHADLVAAWDVVHRHFGEHDAPSTLLGVTVLGYPDQLVEVEVVAAVS